MSFNLVYQDLQQTIFKNFSDFFKGQFLVIVNN